MFFRFVEENYIDKARPLCAGQHVLHHEEFCSLTDGAWISGKKDHLVNIGGWLAVNNNDLFDELRNLVVVYEACIRMVVWRDATC